MKRFCKWCERVLPIEMFPRNGHGTRRPNCKPCHNDAKRAKNNAWRDRAKGINP